MIAVSSFAVDRVQLFLKTIKIVDLGCTCVHFGLKLATALSDDSLRQLCVSIAKQFEPVAFILVEPDTS